MKRTELWDAAASGKMLAEKYLELFEDFKITNQANYSHDWTGILRVLSLAVVRDFDRACAAEIDGKRSVQARQ